MRIDIRGRIWRDVKIGSKPSLSLLFELNSQYTIVGIQFLNFVTSVTKEGSTFFLTGKKVLLATFVGRL